MLTRSIRHFLLALQFFTRIPIPSVIVGWVGYSPAMLRASTGHLPGVGWVVGGLTAMVMGGALVALPALPASAWVAAVLSTLFSILLTGAFHEDGLADTVDGLGGGLTRTDALKIMKDSRIGSYGSAALVLSLVCQFALLVLLIQIDLAWAIAGLFAAHVTSRLMPLFVIRWMAYVGDVPQSKSESAAGNISNLSVAVGLLWSMMAMALTAYGVPTMPLWGGALGALLAMILMAWLLYRRLQGYTGDGLGAVQQLSEIGFYLGLTLATKSV